MTPKRRQPLLHYVTYAITNNEPFVFYALTLRAYLYPLSDDIPLSFPFIVVSNFCFLDLTNNGIWNVFLIDWISYMFFFMRSAVHWRWNVLCVRVSTDWLNWSHRAACVSIYPFKIQLLINLMALIFWWNTLLRVWMGEYRVWYSLF